MFCSKFTPKFVNFLSLLVAAALLSAGAFAQNRKPRIKPLTASVTISASNPTPEQRRLEAFSIAWSAINDYYFDKTFGGVDWEKVRSEFQPRVAAAKSDLAFHRLLEEMLSRLKKSHLGIIIPEYFANLEAAREKAKKKGEQMSAERRAASGGKTETERESDEHPFGNNQNERYGIGVELRMMEGRIVITKVDEHSGAVIAGLKAGYVIDKINGVSISDMIRQSRIDGNSDAKIKYLYPIQLVDSFLNGDPDTSVFLTCLDENDKPADFTVPRLGLSGQSVTISTSLPDQFLKYDSKSLSRDVGYIKFNAFAVPVIAKFCDTLTEFRDKKAIILDLRGNLGGVLGSMMGLAGMLNAADTDLGTFATRAGRSPFVAQSKNKNFKGKVVILVDSLTMSAAELFTAGLQGRGRAVVVGERTGGQSLPAIWTRLSTGAVMLYPIADFITPKGISLEGTGLLPDQTVVLDRAQLLKGVHNQLEKAIAISSGPAADAASGAPTVEMRLDRVTKLKTSGSTPPPPPPPIASGSGRSAGPPPPPRRDVVPESDARSLQVIKNFADVIGGYEKLNAITAYEAKGTTVMGMNGETEGDVYVARQKPDKFLMVITSPNLGEIREVYNGKVSFMQADYGLEQNLFRGQDTTRVNLFSPIFDAIDPAFLKGLKYEGEFEIEGRKRHVLSGKTVLGAPVGLSFDAASKTLVTYSWGGMLYTLGDYRQVGSVKLPFSIELEGLMKITLSSITLNNAVDVKTFEKVEKCYDKAN
jgi:C-terminal peptidase prc